MEISVRDSLKGDLRAIYRIRVNPAVSAQQYPISSRETFESWKQKLGNSTDSKHCAVLNGEEVIGFIVQHTFSPDGKKACYCGWSLAPEYWGRGLMAQALAQVFDSLFLQQEFELVISECFTSNQRCIRLLEKLHFYPISFGLIERIKLMFANRSLRWVLRFRLDAEVWIKQRSEQTVQS